MSQITRTYRFVIWLFVISQIFMPVFQIGTGISKVYAQPGPPPPANPYTPPPNVTVSQRESVPVEGTPPTSGTVTSPPVNPPSLTINTTMYPQELIADTVTHPEGIKTREDGVTDGDLGCIVVGFNGQFRNATVLFRERNTDFGITEKWQYYFYAANELLDCDDPGWTMIAGINGWYQLFDNVWRDRYVATVNTTTFPQLSGGFRYIRVDKVKRSEADALWVVGEFVADQSNANVAGDTVCDSCTDSSAVEQASPEGGAPINLATGFYTYTQPDISIPGNGGESITFRHTYSGYNGLDVGHSFVTDWRLRPYPQLKPILLGDYLPAAARPPLEGWRHNYMIFLNDAACRPVFENGVQVEKYPDKLFTASNGSQHCFLWNETTQQYEPALGFTATLQKEGTAYSLTLRDHTRYQFNDAGRLLRIDQLADLDQDGQVDDSWKAIYLHYQSNRLSQISTAATLCNGSCPGVNYLQLKYDSVGRIIELHDQRGGSALGKPRVTFQYDLAQCRTLSGIGIQRCFLTGVTDLNGQSWRYDYKALKDHAGFANYTNLQQFDSGFGTLLNIELWQVVDPRGNVVERQEYVPVPTTPAPPADSTSDPRAYAFYGALKAPYAASFIPFPPPPPTVLKQTRGRLGTNNALLTPETLISLNVNAYKKMSTVTDGNGNQIRYTFQDGTLSEMKYINNPAITTDDEVIQTGFNQPQRRPGGQKDIYGNITNTTWSADGYDQTSMTDASGAVTQYIPYPADPYHRLWKIIDPLGNTTEYLYQNVRFPTLPTLVRDAQGHETVFVYDASGNMTQMVAKNDNTLSTDDHTTCYTYNSFGQKTSMTLDCEGQGLTTQFIYDEIGQLIKITDTLGRSNVLAYDAAGHVTRTIQNYQGSDLSPAALMSVVHDPAFPDKNITSTMTYDAAGNMASVTDTLDNKTVYEYDFANRVTKTVVNYVDGVYSASAPDTDITTKFTYDGNSNLVSITDNANHLTRRCYDSHNRLVREVINVTLTGNVCTLAHTVSTTTDVNLMTSISYQVEVTQVGTNTVKTERRDVTNPAGRVTRYYYDTLSRLVAVVSNYNDGKHIFTIDAQNTVVDPVDQDLISLIYYDSLGNVIRTVDPMGRVNLTCYDSLNQKTREIVNLSGTVATNQFQHPGNPCTGYLYAPSNQTDFDLITDYTYDGAGRLSTVTAPENHTTQYVYDKLGRVTKEITNKVDGIHQPGDAVDVDVVTAYEYDAAGNVTRIIEHPDMPDMIRKTVACYDALNRNVKRVVNAVSPQPCSLSPSSTIQDIVSEIAYDSLGRVVQQYDPNMIGTAFVYDKLGRITDTIGYSSFGDSTTEQRTTTSYDGLGNVLKLTDPLNKATLFTYDNLSRLTRTQTPEGIQTCAVYDILGQVTSRTSACSSTESVATSYTYDAAGRLATSVQNPVSPYTFNVPTAPDRNVQVKYRYDVAGNLLESFMVISGVNRSLMTYEYDAMNRPVKMLGMYQKANANDPLPTSPVWYMNYDRAGRQTSLKNARGETLYYTYDLMDRVTSAGVPGVASKNFTYDLRGRGRQMQDQNGQNLQTTQFNYDALDRLTQTTDPFNRQVTYQYDAESRRTQMTTVDGTASKTIGYSYDDTDRLSAVTDWDTTNDTGYQDTQYVYDKANRIREMHLPNGVKASYTYDNDGRLTGVTYTDIWGKTLMSYQYTLDKRGNRIAAVENMGSATDFTGFTLVNADTGADIGPLTNNGVITVGSLPTWNISIRANLSGGGTAGSVKLEVQGPSFTSYADSSAPYAIAGNLASGAYQPWAWRPGTYTLTATPYTGSQGSGTAGTPTSITFEVVPPACNRTASTDSELVSAITVSNSVAGADVICVTGLIETYTAHNNTLGYNAFPPITSDITIIGGTLYSTSEATRLFIVQSAGKLKLVSMVLGNVAMTGPASGGIIYVNGGQLTLDDTSLLAGKATNGGAIFNASGTITALGTTFDTNTATGSGGAIYTNTLVKISEGTFINNGAGTLGGAIRSTAGGLNIMSSYFGANFAAQGGAAITMASATASTITNTEFNTNSVVQVPGTTTSLYGGGLYFVSNTVTLKEDRFLYNSIGVNYEAPYAPAYGGGLYINGGTVTLTDSAISGNSIAFGDPSISTVGRGGGIFENAATLTVNNSVIDGNVAVDGGGGVYNSNGTLNIDNSSILGNQTSSWTANSDGGGIFVLGTSSRLTVTDSIISSNFVGDLGGGVSYTSGTVKSITNSCIEGNTTGNYGGMGIHSAVAFTATGNWWGSPEGPTVAGPELWGDVNSPVIFTGYLTTECPAGNGATPAGNPMAMASRQAPGSAESRTVTAADSQVNDLNQPAELETRAIPVFDEIKLLQVDTEAEALTLPFSDDMESGSTVESHDALVESPHIEVDSRQDEAGTANIESSVDVNAGNSDGGDDVDMNPNAQNSVDADGSQNWNTGLLWVPDTGSNGSGWFADSLTRNHISSMVLASPLDLTRVQKPEMRFWRKADLSSADTVVAEVSTNGEDWTPVYSETNVHGDWAEQVVDLSSFNGQIIYLRFTLITAGDIPEGEISLGYWLDDVSVVDLSSTLEATLEATVEATAEVTLEATLEATAEATAEATVEVTETPIVTVPTTEPGPLTIGSYEETHPALRYAGSWSAYTEGAIDYIRSITPHDRMAFTFDGSDIIVHRAIGPSFGSMDVCFNLVCQTVSNENAEFVPDAGIQFTVPAGITPAEIRVGDSGDLRLNRIEVLDNRIVLPTQPIPETPVVSETTEADVSSTPTVESTWTATALPEVTLTPTETITPTPEAIATEPTLEVQPEQPGQMITQESASLTDDTTAARDHVSSPRVAQRSRKDTTLPQPIAEVAQANPTPLPTTRYIVYTYDGLQRVTSAKYYAEAAHTTLLQSFTYTYDLFGNRKTQVVNGQTTTYVYDNANKLTQETRPGNSIYTYGYDANGNRISTTHNNQTTATYTYDTFDRLTQYQTLAAGTPLDTFTYTYNSRDDRLSQTWNNTTTQYLLDLNSGLTQVLGEFNTTSNTYYLLGLDVLGQQQNNTWSYYGYDGLGSLRQTTRQDGYVGLSATYDPYGGLLEKFGTRPTRGFTGEMQDPSALVYLRARYYDPASAVFLSRDPVLGIMGRAMTFNGYSYVEGNPVNYTDHTGRCAEPASFVVCTLIVGAVAGAVVGAVADIILQLTSNVCAGRDLRNIDVGQVGRSALAGAFIGMTAVLWLHALAATAPISGVAMTFSATLPWGGYGAAAIGSVVGNTLAGGIGYLIGLGISSAKGENVSFSVLDFSSSLFFGALTGYWNIGFSTLPFFERLWAYAGVGITTGAIQGVVNMAVYNSWNNPGNMVGSVFGVTNVASALSPVPGFLFTSIFMTLGTVGGLDYTDWQPTPTPSRNTSSCIKGAYCN